MNNSPKFNTNIQVYSLQYHYVGRNNLKGYEDSSGRCTKYLLSETLGVFYVYLRKLPTEIQLPRNICFVLKQKPRATTVTEIINSLEKIISRCCHFMQRHSSGSTK